MFPFPNRDASVHRDWPADARYVVVVGPPGRCATGAEPRLRRAIAPEGLHVAGEGCGQGRDDVRVSHRLWRRVDGAQEAEAGPRQARALQKDVPWRVRLLSADYAAGGWAVPRAASGTGWCRPTSDAVKIRLSPPPVAGSQLVDVDIISYI